MFQASTCKPALGHSFAAGTTDGGGGLNFTQGDSVPQLTLGCKPAETGCDNLTAYLCACRRCGRRPLLGWDQRRFAWPTVQSDEGMSSSQTNPVQHRGGEARRGSHVQNTVCDEHGSNIYAIASDNDPQSVYHYSLTLTQVMMLHPAPHRLDFKFQERTWTVNLDCEVQLAQTLKESWA